ncbi:hypothetical protein BUALT_Bualt04G0181300 [Buddleja alternifolia]|uniref:Glutaredoxin domain-containing protein n=1 Tax=Buddleja alternifolia TaxID=168488 RepID=A0AAV6XRF2_9LAMI|nr:hypothetical protein BUALT_Bualt04G0181300 [Buddleja alternifolia]
MASLSQLVAHASAVTSCSPLAAVATPWVSRHQYHRYPICNTAKINKFHGLCSTVYDTVAISLKLGSTALPPELKTTLDKVVTSQKVVLFMKGTKEFPQCGFSNTVVQILKSLNVPFETINILENEILHQGLKEYSSWPTFPQLYIDGVFFGGCDITLGMFNPPLYGRQIHSLCCSYL